MKNIKAVIFDLGGVLFNINYKKTINALLNLGIHSQSFLYSQEYQSEIFNQLETGLISSEEFLLKLQKESSNHSIQEVKKAWNSMLLDLPKERVKILKNIKKKKSIFLLSNTNAIHVAEIKKKIGLNNYTKFYNLFKKVYYSHEIKLRKPDEKAFILILKENQLAPKEVLFIDDSIQHINTAKKIGINSVLLEKHQDFTKLAFDKFL